MPKLSLSFCKRAKNSGSKSQESIYIPTDEQAAIIEADPHSPAVVIAGAGSGKTETMGARVLWLVANGIVRPDEILGLTFTRKAAGELSTRIRKRLRLLQRARLVPEAIHGIKMDLTVPVYTYHSYAGRVLSEHSIRLGIDTDAQPIGEAENWQIANEIVENFSDPHYEILHSAKTLVTNLLNLSGQIGEHGQNTDSVRQYCLELLEKLERYSSAKSNADVRNAISVLKERLVLLQMVDQLQEYRLSHGALSFNDQMSIAATLVEKFPDIGQQERSKYKVVLLDEYQDTSYSQVRFLSHLFGSGHSVTAVGDPNQAIYGWRSASPETLGTFGQRFPRDDGRPVPVYKLLTTWRNDEQILTLANRVIDRIAENQVQRSEVDRLQLRRTAGPGIISATSLTTQAEEASYIADQFSILWNAPERMGTDFEKRSTFAVLVRGRSQIQEIEEALRDRGIPVEVLGLGGLIHTPEIADIIALLKVLTFPGAGTSMMRLLTGPRLSLGPVDLAALGSYARSLNRDHQSSRNKTIESVLEFGDSAIAETEDFPTGSIIEALESLHSIDSASSHRFSVEGLERLKVFAHQLKGLRRTMNGSITDCIIEAEQFLGLDVEVLVRDGWQHGRIHLDKFIDEAGKFGRSGGTLAHFLDWLDVVDKSEDGLKPTNIEVNRGAVQILTVHHSKGAEWDVVAIPGLAEKNFPSSGKASDIWTKNSGSLPTALRGDRDQIPDFSLADEGASPTATQIGKDLKDFDRRWKEKRREEELRLAYVAFTRAKTHLFCTTSWFRDGEEPVDHSELFTLADEVAQALNPETPIAVDEKPTQRNPKKENPKTGSWPRSLARAEIIAFSAEIVRQAKPLNPQELLAQPEQISASAYSYARDAAALIEEIRLRQEPATVYLPARMSVSALLNLSQNPTELALSIRRPMPGHIDVYARRGTQFHTWLEQRFNSGRIWEDDELDPNYVPTSDEIPLQELQQKWLASSWAARQPHAVEVPFETVVEGVLLRGRIDAVYREGDSYEIVDWKTGKEKRGDDLDVAAIQLAMYRLAYSVQHGIELSRISAAFYYVGSDQTVRPADLYDLEQITRIISAVDQQG